MTVTHYLNSDFDLSLRPRPRQLGQPKLARQVRELSVQALLGTTAGQSALVRMEVPQEFLAHLDGCGIPVPRLLLHPGLDPASRLRPFGWSAEAIALNRRHARPVAHPPPDVVERVNSRSFALELEANLASGGPLGTLVETPAELERFLSRAPAASEWVVKAEHGHAGLASRRLRRSRLTPTDLRFVERRFAEDDRLVIEPWLPRERDWGVVFDVPFDRATLHVHETIGTRDGAMIGALFDPGGSVPAPWFVELADMAERVASKLGREGYFGPVCVDAFDWRDGDRLNLRTLVDLNCRHSMADGAYRMWRDLVPERTMYYRFFSRRKLKSLPADLPAALAALGRRRYDRSERLGILLASPLRLRKLAVVFVAAARAGIFELESWFRGQFEG